MNKAELDQILQERCAADAKFYGKLMGAAAASATPAPAPAPAPPPDIYEESLKMLQKGSPLLAAWRRLFASSSARIAQEISDKLGKLSAAGQTPVIDYKQIDEALRKPAATPFHPQILNDFAGYSTGPGPTGALVYKSWDKVIEQGAWRLQKATQSATDFVRPADIKGTDADHQLNAYSRETGLIAFHTGTYGPGPKQNLLFIFYPLSSGHLLWMGQTVDDQGKPNAGNTYTVAVNYKSESGGQRAFLLVLFELTIDPKGNIALIDGPPVVAFIADSPAFLQLRERIVGFQETLFGRWRTNLRSGQGTKLSNAIANAFDAERMNQARQVFPSPQLSGAELQAAFGQVGQRFSFALHDLNQFAGKWQATVFSFPGAGGAPTVFPQFLTWLDFTLTADGYFQRVVGSSSPVDDPLLLFGDEPGLQNLVLDAWLPECGLASWLRGYGPDPGSAESGVLAFKLASDRTLWVSQFFSTAAVETAMSKKTKSMPKNDEFNLTLEWILPDGLHRKRRYLVSMFFTIDFTKGTAAINPAMPIVKVKSYTD